MDRVVPAGRGLRRGGRAVAPLRDRPGAGAPRGEAAIDGGLDLDLASGLAWESQLFAALFATDDRREGMAAFVEKRKPNFTGR